MTTSHAVNREEVMAFLDGELAAARAADVEAHISGCAECRALVDALRQLSGTLNQWPIDSIPADLQPRVGATPGASGLWDLPARASWWKARSLFGLRRWVVVAAPAAVILAIVLVRSPVDLLRLPMAAHTEDLPSSAIVTYEPGQDAPPPDATLGSRRTSTFQGRGGQGQQGQQGNRPQGSLSPSAAERSAGPMIARSVSLSIVSEHFADIRPNLERLAARLNGMIGALQTTGEPTTRRSLHATVRVPANQLDAALTEIRRLGQVREETQSSEDVADAHRDLVVRIANGQKEEARLNELLSRRTDRLQDVLAVEQEVTRVRGEIERMSAEEIAMRNRVAYATITLDVVEAYRAEASLGPVSIRDRLRNASVEGWRTAASSALDGLLVLLQVGPSVLMWMTLVGTLAWYLWRRTRRTV